jgi:hypothetical protein
MKTTLTFTAPELKPKIIEVDSKDILDSLITDALKNGYTNCNGRKEDGQEFSFSITVKYMKSDAEHTVIKLTRSEVSFLKRQLINNPVPAIRIFLALEKFPLVRRLVSRNKSFLSVIRSIKYAQSIDIHHQHSAQRFYDVVGVLHRMFENGNKFGMPPLDIEEGLCYTRLITKKILDVYPKAD